jgi:hypothetical protein
VIEAADVIQQGVEAGNDLSGFNPGNVHLWQTQTLAKVALAPSFITARLS